MRRTRTLLQTAVLVVAMGGAAWAGPARAPRIERLDGAPASAAAAGPQVLVFWRADCGPCLRELSDLAALRAAARPGRLTPVGLQPAAQLRPALRRLGLADGDSALTREDPAALLTRLGGAPPRLPLAVAFRADGSVCARRSGLLGYERLRAWARACGGAHA